MRVLILGGTLFIGLRIALELLARVGDLTTGTVRDWALAILAAAGSEASLVTVPEDLVPPDLEDTRSIAQHFLVDSRKAATLLGWRPSDPAETIPLSVRWHLENSSFRRGRRGLLRRRPRPSRRHPVAEQQARGAGVRQVPLLPGRSRSVAQCRSGVKPLRVPYVRITDRRLWSRWFSRVG